MKEVIGYSPSLVDVALKLPDAQYVECCSVLGVQPGGWSPIADADHLKDLLSVINESDVEGNPYATIAGHPDAAINAGSSILGMIGVMPREKRQKSAIITAHAMDGGQDDPLATTFNKAVMDAAIEHIKLPKQGYNPVCLVLSGETIAEKTLATYPGIADELTVDPQGLDPKLIILDAYELRGPVLGDGLRKLIGSGQYNIGLSLGNHTILDGELGKTIRQYIEDGLLYAVCGNQEEYQALYPELNSDATEITAFGSHPVLATTPYALMTAGVDGMVAHWDGELATTPACSVEESSIVNTSGAGDTSAGIFYAGILDRTHPQKTLEKAASMASKVICHSASRLVID